MAGKHPGHQTQWAAQFGLASELCKRGYQVALTMGNHPVVDLMVVSPGGVGFSIDVKGLHKRNFWLVKPKRKKTNLYYVLALVPGLPDPAPSRFFVLTQDEVNREVPRHLKRIARERTKKGLPIDKVGTFPGLSWSFTEPFEDKWEKLPK